jgi:hypothetical protein
MMLAVIGAMPGPATAHGAEGGIVMVLCADGETKTVILAEDGNFREPAEKDRCSTPCRYCLAIDGDFMMPPGGREAAPAASEGVLPFVPASGRAPLQTWTLPEARGPPSWEIA